MRDQDEARFAPAVRHVDPVAPIRGVFRELARDKQGVGASDDGRLIFGQGLSPVDRSFLAYALDLASRGGLAGLDVFGTVSVALDDLDLKTLRAPAAHFAVNAIASATLELDPQGSHVRAIDERLAQGISINRPRRHVECARAGRPDEPRLTGQGRCPGPADGVDRADYQKGQARKKLLMLLRHVIANHPPAQFFHLILNSEPGLDLFLATMKG